MTGLPLRQTRSTGCRARHNGLAAAASPPRHPLAAALGYSIPASSGRIATVGRRPLAALRYSVRKDVGRPVPPGVEVRPVHRPRPDRADRGPGVVDAAGDRGRRTAARVRLQRAAGAARDRSPIRAVNADTFPADPEAARRYASQFDAVITTGELFTARRPPGRPRGRRLPGSRFTTPCDHSGAGLRRGQRGLRNSSLARPEVLPAFGPPTCLRPGRGAGNRLHPSGDLRPQRADRAGRPATETECLQFGRTCPIVRST